MNTGDWRYAHHLEWAVKAYMDADYLHAVYLLGQARAVARSVDEAMWARACMEAARLADGLERESLERRR